MSSGPERKRPSIWSTASLRLAAAFSLLFGLGGAGLIAGVDYGLMRFAEAEVREGLSHQMAVMQADAERHGSAELARTLNAEPRNREARRYLLLVSAPDGTMFSNGLTPAAVDDGGFRHNLPSKGRAARWPDQTPNMLVLSARAPDGGLLAVGRDTQHLDELRGGIRRFALFSGLALVGLGLLGGLVVGWLFLGRLEGVNQAVGRIIAGRESERLPAIGFGREFDDLAAHLNRMLDRQEAALSALKTLSEGVAHELRAPLNRLRNRLEEVEAVGDDAAARTIALERAVEEMDQVNALFESLLALARIETGVAVKSEPLDLSELIRDVGEIYRPLVEGASGMLSLPERAQACVVRGDPALLRQALADLIENAVLHGGEAPSVTLFIETGEDGVAFGVADDGPGIAPEEREQAVRRFHRLEASRAHPGTGLGLSLADAVSRAHSGALILSDNRPGLRAEIRIARERDEVV